MCVITLTMSWTASSQITGIDREQKVEIVRTLKDYPLVKLELKKTQELNSSLQKQNISLESLLTSYQEQNKDLRKIISITESQLNITEKQLKTSRKGNGLLFFGGGVVLGIGITAILLH